MNQKKVIPERNKKASGKSLKDNSETGMKNTNSSRSMLASNISMIWLRTDASGIDEDAEVGIMSERRDYIEQCCIKLKRGVGE
jgi:hypothetical protein